MSDTPNAPLVLVRDDGAGVRVLTLNRPERANAWTMALEEEYFLALIAAAADPAVRVVVVTGAGKTFCPGMDAEALESTAKGGEFSQRGRIRQTLPLSIPKPIVAAINGACAGIGLVQALMCDVRFCAGNAKLTTAFARRGLPAENGVAWVLARLVGQGRAADLLLSARVLTAVQAVEVGLVNEVADDALAAALDYAQDVAQHCSPRALAEIKQQLYGSLELRLEEARLESKQVFERVRYLSDFAEGVRSYVERRAPRFEPFSAALDPDAFRD